MRPKRRRTTIATGPALLAIVSAATAADLPRPRSAVPHAVALAFAAGTLECDGLRRLSDNFLLDLQIRMVFDSARHRYKRYENTGRGWQEIAGSSTYRVEGPRIVLDPNPFVTSYLERLTSNYYYTDSTGTTLSVWGHCGVVGPVRPFF